MNPPGAPLSESEATPLAPALEELLGPPIAGGPATSELPGARPDPTTTPAEPPLDLVVEDLRRPWDDPAWAGPSWMSGLNPAQREAVLHAGGPLLVQAGAGSGKTRVLMVRIAHLVRHLKVAPARILAVTFTRKAAHEMRERLAHLLTPEEAEEVTLATFHGLGVQLLRTFALAAGLPARFSIVGEDDVQRRLRAPVKRCNAAIREAWTPPVTLDAPPGDDDGLSTDPMRMLLAAAGPDVPEVRGGDAAARIGLAKLATVDALARSAAAAEALPDDLVAAYREGTEATWATLLEGVDGTVHPQWQSLYREYQEGLASDGAVDYEDLLALPVLLLLRKPDVLRQVRERWTHLLVDEYQDTDYVQDHLLRLMAGPAREICAVGDEDQSIYSFRRAKVENIRTFAERFAPCHVVPLEQNYRSGPTILRAANAALAARGGAGRAPRRLWTERQDERPLRVWTCSSSYGEADAVARDILAAQRDGAIRSLDDVFVLYRVNTLARPVEEALRRAGIPYRLAGGRGLIDRADPRTLLAMLRIAFNPHDLSAFELAVSGQGVGVGPAAVEALGLHARAHGLSVLDAAASGAVTGVRGAAARGLAAAAVRLREVAEIADRLGLAAAYRRALESSGLYALRLEELGNAEAEEDEEEVRVAAARLQDLEDLTLYVEEFARGLARRDPPVAGATQIGALLDELTTLGLHEDPDHTGPTRAEAGGAVTLMTVHSAKGLEARRVYLVGVDEKLFPVVGSGTPRPGALTGDQALAEEARLFYVALTRAGDDLILSTARTREARGNAPQPFRPSRFLATLPETVYCAEAQQ